MGVLDEAIRQHIELKRRHGASEQELQRKQEEALGPALREAPAESSDGDEAPVEDTAAAAPGPTETPFSEQETRIFSPADAPDETAQDAPEADLREEAAEPSSVDDWLEPELEPDPDLAPAGREDDPLADDPADEPEDVLEETPDFLQETPEHDRLWFEQKPPRDFDFDDDK